MSIIGPVIERISAASTEVLWIYHTNVEEGFEVRAAFAFGTVVEQRKHHSGLGKTMVGPTRNFGFHHIHSRRAGLWQFGTFLLSPLLSATIEP